MDLFSIELPTSRTPLPFGLKPPHFFDIVSVVQCISDLRTQLCRFTDGERRSRQPISQRHALDEIADDEHGIFRPTHLMDADDGGWRS